MSCCAKKTTEQSVYESVKEYYGKVLSNTEDLKTSACTASSAPPRIIQQILKQIPEEILMKFYGCGTPIPLGIEGLNVLDLGSGSGRDCYIASKLVGEKGSVTGVDMTEEQLSVATKHVDEFCTKTLGYSKPNLKFVKGYIEFLEEAGIQKSSMDLVISNCVVNLSPNKKLVLQGVFNALKEGGEFYFSDVYCNRRLPEAVRQHKVLYGECIAGALYVEDFKRLCYQVGFADPRVMSVDEIKVRDPVLKEVIGEAKFYSITYRLFKLSTLESLCEDYGQVAVYQGTIPGNTHAYDLDDHHRFEAGKPALVCGNTASMLEETWLKNHFTIIGNRNVHYGLFDCGSGSTTTSNNSSSSAAACGTGGGCC